MSYCYELLGRAHHADVTAGEPLNGALGGINDRWDDIERPGFGYDVVENTLGKYGTRGQHLAMPAPASC
jgi:hypothetical protein